MCYDRSSPSFLVYYPDQNTVKKVRCVKFNERFDKLDESFELPHDSVRRKKPEMPKPDNREARVKRYPARESDRQKYLDE